MDIIRNEKGEGYIDVCVLVLCVFLMLGLVVNVLPVYVAKNQLDTFAQELCREAEMGGRVGPDWAGDKQKRGRPSGKDRTHAGGGMVGGRTVPVE